MKDKKASIDREFGRMCATLNELHRRIYSDDDMYPKSICGAWFANYIEDMVTDEDLKDRLIRLKLTEIRALCNSVLKSDDVNEEDKFRIIDTMQTLANNNNKEMEL